MVHRLTHFSVGQTAKVLGFLYALIGLVLVPIFILAGILSPEEERPFGVGFALLLPILYGLVGFVGTAIGCALYNFIAGKVGGIELSLETGTAPV
jgi:hypothetical protein